MALKNLVVAANRLPIRQTYDAHGNLVWTTSPGGLASALTPVMEKAEQVTWVGWPGQNVSGKLKPFRAQEIDLIPIEMSAIEHENHYEGMSNGTLWPLYHDKVVSAVFHRHWYDGYSKINQRFAAEIAEVIDEDSTVWVNDYQLQLVPALLRSRAPKASIGFFLHTPFPPAELFCQLPWRVELLEGLLGCDLVGMQTPASARNFIDTLETLGLGASDGEVFHHKGGTTQIKAFPIGIDVAKYANAAKSAATEKRSQEIRSLLGNPKFVLLGVDRLDYTKGIEIRLRAFRELLADSEIDPAQVSMVQVAVPSRNNVKAYERIKSEVEQSVGNINGTFSTVGRSAVEYLNQDQDFEELMGLYRAADAMLVTPFKDGMNLVAMEYAATRFDNSGSLILSEFAGAAHICDGAQLVNPYSIDEIKAAILHAIRMDPIEQKTRMEILRNSVEAHDVNIWADSFIETLQSKP